LYLHLSYVPRRTGVNQCFQKLCQQGVRIQPDGQHFQQKPHEVKGLARVETLQAQGPLPEDADTRQKQLQQLQSDLEQLRLDLQITEVPEDAAVASQRLRQMLSHTTEEWFQIFCDEGHDERLVEDLPDRWILLLGDQEGHFGPWFEAEFMKWGQDDLPDVIAGFLDGRAETLVDEAFCELVAIFPRFEMQTKHAALVAKCGRLTEEMQTLFLHRKVRRGNANAQERAVTAAHVPSSFANQHALFDQLREVEWFDLPADCKVPIWSQPSSIPIFLIAHLFSGRRREGDVHSFLVRWASQVVVLSLDTANSETMGNLHVTSVTWKQLLRLYREGRIAATLAGAPCETWSAARHHKLDGEDIEHHEGSGTRHRPRPLRSAGLDGLIRRELRQLSQGTHIFMQTAITIAWSICTGGLYISEHPAPPDNEHIASVWTTPWIQILRKHPDIALHVMNQWKWGYEAVKPTGLLALRMPRFAFSMYSRQCPDAVRPKGLAIGRGPDGRFRTSALKEYPVQFCAAMAGAIIDELHRRRCHNLCTVPESPDQEVVQVHEAEALCGQIREGASWLPDFQDR
jgi:hypothetical protein